MFDTHTQVFASRLAVTSQTPLQEVDTGIASWWDRPSSSFWKETATEKMAWGEPTWRVRGKLFAQLDDHHHGADHLAVWLPAPLVVTIHDISFSCHPE